MKLYPRDGYVLDKISGKRFMSVGLGGTNSDTRHSFNLDNVKAQGVDLSGTFSASLARASKDATFVDISETALEVFAAQLPDSSFYYADITRPPSSWPEGLTAKKYDVIVLGEVLEHIADPGTALRNLQAILADDGELVITVPSAFGLARFVKMAFGKEDVHPEHVCYYSPKTIARLLEMSGYTATGMGWASGNKFTWASLKGRSPLYPVVLLITLVFPAWATGLVASARLAKPSEK